MALLAVCGCGQAGYEPAPDATSPADATTADVGQPDAQAAEIEPDAQPSAGPRGTCEQLRRSTVTAPRGLSAKRYYCPPPAKISELTLPVHIARDPVGPLLIAKDSDAYGVYGYVGRGAHDWPELHPEESCVWVPIDVATCETR
jgi:hypothetical protein